MSSVLANRHSVREATAFFKWTRESKTGKSVSLQSNVQNRSQPEPWTNSLKGKGRVRPRPRPTLHSENQRYKTTPKIRSDTNKTALRKKIQKHIPMQTKDISDLLYDTLDGIPTRMLRPWLLHPNPCVHQECILCWRWSSCSYWEYSLV